LSAYCIGIAEFTHQGFTRRMKYPVSKPVTGFVLCFLLGATALPAVEPNQLSEQERTNGWRLLFDGHTTTGWRNLNKKGITATNGWVVEEGWLKKIARVRGGDIITDQTFDDFDLEWEWRIPAKANNGVKYFILEPRGGIGHEYQMADDATIDDPKGLTAGFYDVLPPGKRMPTKLAPEINRSRVRVSGDHVEHWLNGEKVLDYDCGSTEVMAAVARSKFKAVRGFGTKVRGHILLTDHNDEAWFRNIKIREPMAPAPAALPTRTNVFVSGQDGYHSYRIPSLLVTPRGTLLAFCEGRKESAEDSGQIDLLLKRSPDRGATWTPAQTVWNDGTNTCGNPCPVADRDSGVIWLLLTWNRGDDPEWNIIKERSKDTRRAFVCRSDDDGQTWSKPREITGDVKTTNWTWYATGPGAGLQIEHGPHRGRLVIPCDHIEAGTRKYFSHVIYSDDHGTTWRLGGSTPQDQVNECEAVELANGELLLNMRNYDRTQRTRQTALSTDGGLTWTEQRHDAALVEPICQASIRRYAWPGEGRRSVILFSNPASLRRERLTLRASYDEGRTWPAARLLDPRPSAYSCLAVLPDGTIGVFYEAGSKSPYEALVFARLKLDWLTAGE
jgi:sialidase-1